METLLGAVVVLGLSIALVRSFHERRFASMVPTAVGGLALIVIMTQPTLLVDLFGLLIGDGPPPVESSPSSSPTPEPAVPWEDIGAIAAMLGGGIAGVSVLGLGGAALWHVLRQRRDRAHEQDTADAALQRRWEHASERYNSVRNAYGDYVTDALRVLELPQLNNVADPATAAFLDALADADYFHREQCPSAEPDVAAFDEATKTLTRTWRTALQNARTVGTTALSDEDSERVATARHLLERATHPDTPDPERQTAYRRARDKLRGVVDLPQDAIATIETHNRLALPPGEIA